MNHLNKGDLIEWLNIITDEYIGSFVGIVDLNKKTWKLAIYAGILLTNLSIN